MKGRCYTLKRKDDKPYTLTVCYSDSSGLWSGLSTFEKEYGHLPLYRKGYFDPILVENILQSIEVISDAQWNTKMEEFQ